MDVALTILKWAMTGQAASARISPRRIAAARSGSFVSGGCMRSREQAERSCASGFRAPPARVELQNEVGMKNLLDLDGQTRVSHRAR
jgi:hypothetical protein